MDAFGAKINSYLYWILIMTSIKTISLVEMKKMVSLKKYVSLYLTPLALTFLLGCQSVPPNFEDVSLSGLDHREIASGKIIYNDTRNNLFSFSSEVGTVGLLMDYYRSPKPILDLKKDRSVIGEFRGVSGKTHEKVRIIAEYTVSFSSNNDFLISFSGIPSGMIIDHVMTNELLFSSDFPAWILHGSFHGRDFYVNATRRVHGGSSSESSKWDLLMEDYQKFQVVDLESNLMAEVEMISPGSVTRR